MYKLVLSHVLHLTVNKLIASYKVTINFWVLGNYKLLGKLLVIR